MSLTVTKIDVWAAQIEDKPGGLAKLLGALAGAGANLECVIARRDPSNAGKGVAFLTPVKGADVRKAAKEEGLAPAEKLATLKVEGNDAPGIGFSDHISHCRFRSEPAGPFRDRRRPEVCGLSWL
jgi:ACT domain